MSCEYLGSQSKIYAVVRGTVDKESVDSITVEFHGSVVWFAGS